MENIILILVVGCINLLCFYLGSKKESGNIKTINPIEKIKEIKETKKSQEEYEKEQKELQTNLDNIEAYDGSALGQKDFE